MRVILSAPGSRGDVNPMIAIGRQLVRRGHECVISLAQPYVELATAAGLKTETLVDSAGFDRLLGDPKVWTPLGGALQVLRSVASDFARSQYEIVRRHHVAGETVLVAHPLDFGSRIFRDQFPQTPLTTVHLAPAILRVPQAPPRLSPWWFEITRPPWLVRAAYAAVDHLIADRVLGGEINAIRRELGLPPVRRFLDEWWMSPDHLLLMYPRWFFPEADSVQRPITFAGFPLDDGVAAEFEPPADRPIVFTAGTANRHAVQFFDRAIAACHDLGRPGLLLSSHAENLPPSLPDNIVAMTYAPLGRLLPHCSAIVHHGGIGTTSQALAAGIPQVIAPMAFDQFDNAQRVQRLSCGRRLRRPDRLSEELSSALRMTDACKQTATQFTGKSAAEVAADSIEQLHRQSLST